MVTDTQTPAGYKRTDVGVIPADWDVKRLGDCLVRNPEYGINAAAVPYSDNLPVYIRITDISEDGRFLPESKVSVKHDKAGKFFLDNGDIVLARTGASTGKSYLYDPKDGALVFAGFLIRIKTDKSKLNPHFLKCFLDTQIYWNWVDVMSMRSGQPGINGSEYASMPIPFPKIEEQEAIANEISDIDDLIAKLDALIEKKRNIKQGAMHELLTGKRRLPGFSGKWEDKTLGGTSVLKARIGWQGLTTAEYLDQGDFYLVTGTDFKNGKIDWNKCSYVEKQRYSQDKNIQLKPQDVLITKDGTIGKVAFIRSLPKPATLNSGIFVIRAYSDEFDQ